MILRLLAVEDEPELGRLLVTNLSKQGFAIDLAPLLEDARAFLDTCSYALILLDLRLPDGDGLTLLRDLRAARQEVPVIVLSAADAVEDRVNGLSRGADDYVVKPFAVEELAARIRAVLRRPGQALGTVLSMANVSFNTVSRDVVVDGAGIVLPRRELLILESLMRADGRVVTREALEEAGYSLEDERQSNVLDSAVSRLRRRLEAERAHLTVRVVRGVGYRVEPLTAAEAPR